MRIYDEATLKRVQDAELNILKDFLTICEEHDLVYFGFAGTGIGALRHKGFIPWDDDIDVALPRKDFDRFVEVAKEKFKDKYIVQNCHENPHYPFMTTRWMRKGTKFREAALMNLKCEAGIFLDIYPFDNLSDDQKLLKKQARDAWFWSKLLILRSIPKPVLAFRGVKAASVYFICGVVHYGMRFCRIKKTWIIKKCNEANHRYNHLETKRIGYLCDTSPYANMLEKKKAFPLQKLAFEDVQLNFRKDLHDELKHVYGDYMQLPPEDKRKNHYPYELEFADGN